jgi:hypothetical protein
MTVRDIKNSGGVSYDQFLVDSLVLGKAKKSTEKVALETPNKGVDQTTWQKDILTTALSRLENNLQIEDNSPLNYNTAAPIESFQEAIEELRNLVDKNFAEYASKAQANLTPNDILYLFEDENSFVV